ncbi:hypothetical protein TcasGA2_TC016393 [Tribolium castaneum]|uniref:Uncharacterized protein n=1 Tax=Tribolium castaneum TaxID=7070 RepID=D2CFX5_TRICA|nr:hypothetical protein TcasGA2_TC016393 [Tribolium castaneum]
MTKVVILLILVIAVASTLAYSTPHFHRFRKADVDQAEVFRSLSNFFDQLSVEAANNPGNPGAPGAPAP